MALYEAYFDESGNLDADGGILCIAGYVLASESAKEMEAKWKTILDRYEIPYFHMVDCVPKPGAGVFYGMPVERRIELVKELIALIKKHCLHGISFFITRDNFKPDKEKDKDPYSEVAEMCALAIEAIVEGFDSNPKIAYFFEAGHSSEGRAYNRLAKFAAKSGASVSFARKGDAHLLEAADLLAWQSAKYLKDALSKKRAPRKDFLSLMEHRHSHVLLTIDGGELLMQHEEWPREMQPSMGYIRTEDTRTFFDNQLWEELIRAPEQFIISWRLLPVWKATARQWRD